MSALLAERPTAQAPAPAPAAPLDEVDRDGIEVYCPESAGWSRTHDYFCESCGARDHDLR